MEVLNLYCGTGGNRRLWTGCEVTAIEFNDKRAAMYKEEFPNDTVIIADAHQYLLENHNNFDFVWSSPPCQSHSRANYFTQHIRKNQIFPNMELYEEIIFLQNFYKGKWVVENVIPYYEPLIPATKVGRHLFWSNFVITKIEQPKNDVGTMMPKYGNSACKKPIEQRNEVNSELGLHIFNLAKGIHIDNNKQQGKLF